jgi:glycine/D-amino acid oxidase-like deaminating enzyme
LADSLTLGLEGGAGAQHNGAVRHTATGWWLEEAGPVAAQPPLAGDVTADVVVVGGGYAGLWTAWCLLDRGASVVVLEAELCGYGPSGRNGGFVDNLWHAAPRVRTRFGDDAALALGRASGDSVRAIGAWCEAAGVDAWYRPGGQLILAAAPAQDGAGAAVAETCAAIGAPEEALPVSAAQAQARCASPVLRGGTFMPTAATVHPARLALGLRRRLLERGARIFERSRVRALHGATAATAGGAVRAGAAVLAVGSAAASIGPLRRRLTGASSHLLMTEPVPDVLAAIGWTGGEAITDGRALVHYFRTTPDGRIAFGWGGGRIVAGGRTGGRAEVDAAITARVRADLVRFFPALAGRAVEHAWGGPIDASPSHLPMIVPLPGAHRSFAVFGFTGNGVGPAHLCGRILAGLAAGARDDLTRLPIVDPPSLRLPPEPLRWAGGTLIRAGIERTERAEEAGRRPGVVSRALAGAPRVMGVHIGR